MIKVIGLIITLITTAIVTTVTYHQTQQSDIYYYQGHRLFNAGKFDKAIPLCKKSLEIKPYRLDALKDLAYSYQWTGKHTEAIEYFRAIIAINPKDIQAKRSLALTLAWEQQYQEAINIYKEIIKQESDYSSKIQLAEVLAWDKQFDSSEELLRDIIKEKPKDFKLKILLANVLFYSGKTEEACTIYEELLKNNNLLAKNKFSRKKSGVSDILSRQAEKPDKLDSRRPEDIYKDILANNPHESEAALNLAKILVQQKRYDEAFYYFSLASAEKENKGVGLIYAKALLFSGDYARAKELLGRILIVEPDNLEAKIYLADAYAYSKDFKKAEFLYTQILQQKGSREAKKKLADVLSWDRQYEKAIGLYDDLIIL